MTDVVDAIRWLFAVPLGLFGAWIVVCTYGALISSMRTGRRYSMIPLFGGGLVSLAWLLCPALGAKSWAWIPLVIDPSCALLFVVTAVFWSMRLLRGGRAEGPAALDKGGAAGDDSITR